jgi:N-acetylmuramoyl-L-alanine amidase
VKADDVSSESTNELSEADDTEGDYSKVNYFLVTAPYLQTPAAEQFVLSYGDGTENLEDLKLIYSRDDGTGASIECTGQQGELYTFSRDFTAADAGTYHVDGIRYTLNGNEYDLQFSELGMDIQFGVDQTYDGYDDLVSLNDVENVDDLVNGEEDADSSIEGVAETDSTDENAIAQSVEQAVSEVQDGAESESAQSDTTDAGFALHGASSVGTISSQKIICLDPGHGGHDSGAAGFGSNEKTLNLKIANYCREELENNYHVKVVMTRTTDEYVELTERVNIAKANNASLFVCLHLNASNGSAKGAEVYYPNKNWKPEISSEGETLAQEIENQLTSLGISKRGIFIRNSANGSKYSDGSAADYYSVIRNAKAAGIPGIIVEHCFIDNSSDYRNFLSSEANLRKLGVADATGIARACNLPALYSRSKIDSMASENRDAISDGRYVISSAVNQGFAMEVAGNSFSDGANIQLWTKNNTDAQVWTVSHDEKGYVLLEHAASGKVADVKDGRPADQSNVQQNQISGSTAQKWIAVRNADGTVTFFSAVNPYLALDLSGGTAANQQNVQLYSFNGTAAQKWNAEEAAKSDSDQDKGEKTMYRLYNPNSGEHFYTGDETEKNRVVAAGWNDEGTGWIAPESSSTPIYRMYNPNAGDHFYTASASERDSLIDYGWRYEGIGWYSADAKTTPVYRQYNPNAVSGAHNYTTSQAEAKYLVSVGWNDEGLAWYGL